MNSSVIYTLVIGMLIGLVTLGFFVWGVGTGAFEHTEDAKYVLFREDEEDD